VGKDDVSEEEDTVTVSVSRSHNAECHSVAGAKCHKPTSLESTNIQSKKSTGKIV